MKHFKIRPIFFLIFLMQVHIPYVNAQLPAYLPTDGLIGWWPFNGNANDESGNGHNGTVNGATLTTDRFGFANQAYSFDGINDYIQTSYSGIVGSNPRSISFWFLFDSVPMAELVFTDYGGTTCGSGFACTIFPGNNVAVDNTCSYEKAINSSSKGTWLFYTVTFSGVIDSISISNLYLNGILQNSTVSDIQFIVNTISAINLVFGSSRLFDNNQYYQGKIDDIGIWDRILTQQEIEKLFNSSCPNNLTISPQTNSVLSSGGDVMFNASTASSSPSFTWQSDFGQGFQTLRDYGSYSGANTSTLKVSNVQLANHNQPFRVIASESGICFDTSEVVRIQLADTCVQAITDTTFTTVTDTLIIHTMVTDINAIPFVNTIKLFPNPTSTHLTIDYGNFSSLVGYQLRVTNLAGQVIFHTAIHQQSEQLSLSSWGGAGLYLVFLVDPQGHTVDTRKIVLK